MKLIPNVNVQYGSDVSFINDDYLQEDSGSFFSPVLANMVDMRYQAFLPDRSELKGMGQTWSYGDHHRVEVSRWFLTERGRQSIRQRWHGSEFAKSKWEAPLDFLMDINSRLAVLNHFGERAEYNKNFFAVFSEHDVWGDVLLYGFHQQNQEDTPEAHFDINGMITNAPREFHGQLVTRAAMWDKWLVLLDYLGI